MSTAAIKTSGFRRPRWFPAAAIAVPMLIVIALAVEAVLDSHHAVRQRELNRLRFLAAREARDLDHLPSRAAAALDAARPVAMLPSGPPPPLPGRQPLLQRFFAIDARGVARLPRLPFRPAIPGEPLPEASALALLSRPEAFTAPGEADSPPAGPEDADRWIQQLQAAEALVDTGEAVRGLAELDELAATVPECYFRRWVRFRWATVAASLSEPARARIAATYAEIARSPGRELNPDRPLRAIATLRLAALGIDQPGGRQPVLEFLRALDAGALAGDLSRAGYLALRDEADRLLARATAPVLPQDLTRLRAEVALNIHLVDTVLPALPPADRTVRFAVRDLPDGRRIFLAYRTTRTRQFGEAFIEGGLLDFTSPDLPLDRPTTDDPSSVVRFAVTDAAGSPLAGDPVPQAGGLTAAAEAGPDNLLRVVAYRVDAEAFTASRRRNLIVLLGVIAVLGLAALTGGLLAYRSLRHELQLSRLKTEFVAGVSHELRTPLTTIRMFGEMLELGRVRDAQQAERYYTSINREAARLLALIDDLLDFGRMEAGRFVIRPELVPAADPARAAAEAFAHTAEGSGRTLRASYPDDEHTPVPLDAPALERALLNLLVNAARYSAAATPIELRVEIGPQRVVYTVQDHGVGIPRRYRRRVFEKFFRVPESAARAPGGTGLGLALVAQIVNAHGGRIHLESSPGRGSRFALEIPRVAEGIDTTAGGDKMDG